MQNQFQFTLKLPPHNSVEGPYDSNRKGLRVAHELHT